jgi:hypothetical protein
LRGISTRTPTPVFVGVLARRRPPPDGRAFERERYAVSLSQPRFPARATAACRGGAGRAGGGDDHSYRREPNPSHACKTSMRRPLIVALLLSALACTRSKPSPPSSSSDGARSTTPSAECPVTMPEGSHRAGDPAGLEHLGYGNGELWVALWPHGVVRATVDDLNQRGEIVMKFPWDRAVRGRLHITGRRIDAEAPPLRSHVPDYGLTGFQSTAVTFPTVGCWEVTGRVASQTSLTFVTSVTLSS